MLSLCWRRLGYQREEPKTGLDPQSDGTSSVHIPIIVSVADNVILVVEFMMYVKAMCT